MTVWLAAVRVPGDADPWRDLGFTVEDDVIALANGAVRLGGDGCSLEIEGPDLAPATIDGVPFGVAGRVPSSIHRNGAVELDHVVIMTDSLARTSVSIEQTIGLEQRRTRETATVRQAFHRFADTDAARGCIIEVVESDRAPGAAIWGLVMIVDDLDAAVAAADGLIGAPKDAVQPGRRIATVSRTAGLPLAVALMSR